MIIVSQDKDVIVNFDNVGNIWINNPLENDDGKFEIRAENYLNNTAIGEYKTEERAKEILQEIIRAYVTDRKANDTDNFFGFSMMQKDIYFQMPEN